VADSGGVAVFVSDDRVRPVDLGLTRSAQRTVSPA
jgi:hypothetical protein